MITLMTTFTMDGSMTKEFGELDQQQIKMNAEIADWKVEIYDELTSTNTYAKMQFTKESVLQPTVVIAARQTGGYGRNRRPFLSPPQLGIYMTIVWPVENGRFNPGQITMGIALAVSRVGEELVDAPLQIKWVNDVFRDNKKIAGILVEGIANPDDGQLVNLAIGIGLDLLVNPAMPTDLKAKVGALYDRKVAGIDRNLIIGKLLTSIDHVLKSPLAKWMSDYRRRSVVIGADVQLQLGNTLVRGKCVNILDDGRLELQTADGYQTFNAGEVVKVNLPKASYQG